MYERTYNKTVLKHDEKPKRKGFPWKRVLIIAAVLAVVAGVIFSIRAPGLQVREVEVFDTYVADPVEVSQFVLGELAGNYLWILPKSSIVLVSLDTIAMRIQEHFSRFKEVSVDRDSVRKLVVHVKEYEGMYLWCDNECSFMDEKGTVFADAPYFSGSAYLKVYNGERQVFPFEGVPPNRLALITTIDEKLRGISIDPTEFRFNNEHELSVHFIHNTHEARILFDPLTDIDGALNALYTGLRTEPLERLYHDSTQILEYLDARFGGKLVYKFR